MAQSAKRRRVGQTRTTGVASLHPKAVDTRASAEKSPPAKNDITAPPLSSSDEDVTRIKDRENGVKSKRKSLGKQAPESAPQSDMNDSPFGQISSQTRPRATYSRANEAARAKSIRPSTTGTSGTTKTVLPGKISTTAAKQSKDGTTARKTFKPPAEISTNKKKAEFRVPTAAKVEPVKATFRIPAAVEPAPPKRPQFRIPSGPMPDAGLGLATSSPQELAEAEHESTPGTQFPSSQIREILSSNTAASIAGSSADAERELSPTTFATCPICRAPLSEETLDTFQSTLAGLFGKALYPRQAAFCRAHREAEAQHLWSERGYPTIDWTTLPTRFEPHRPTILAVLEQHRASHFRDQLQAELDARRTAGLHIGRDTLAQEFKRGDDGAETVGYYGGRGAQIMMNWLVTSLAEPLRIACDTDPLLKACGSVSAFVQRVLLPELATLLVVDDMRLTKGQGPKPRRLKPPVTSSEAEAARQRLEESAELGRLLCLEEDDEILAEDDEVEEVSGANDSDEESEGNEE